MMQGRKRSQFPSLFAVGLAALSLATSADAANCVKEAVNRTGQPQAEVFARVGGVPEFTGVLSNEPFTAVQPLFVATDGGFDTMVRFFGAPNGGIPSADPNDVTGASLEAARIKTGFSLNAPDFVVARWGWCGAGLAAPATRIPDPSCHFTFVGHPSERMVEVTARNDSGEAVLMRNVVCSVGNNDYTLRTIPLLKGDSDQGSFPGERIMLQQDEMTLLPYLRNGEFEQGIERFRFRVPASVPLHNMNVYLRAILYRRIGTGAAQVTDVGNPVSFAGWHDITSVYRPSMDICVKAGGYTHNGTRRRIQITVASHDPNSEIVPWAPVPDLSYSVLQNASNLSIASQSRPVTHDLWDRPVAHLNQEIDLKIGTSLRQFVVRYTARSQGKTKVRDVYVWLDSSGQVGAAW